MEDQIINAPHRILMQDAELKITDLPDSARAAITQYNAKEHTYRTNKTKFEQKGEEWPKKEEFEATLFELDEEIVNKITLFLEQKQDKTALAQRAKALGLPADATEAKIVEEENNRKEAAKAAADKAAKDSKLSRNEKALKQLHDDGKTTVTAAELKAANFDTGFWGPISFHGCTVGNYRLYRRDQYDSEFVLSKLN